MTRDEFDAAAAHAIRAAARDLSDTGGQPGARLLDNLWSIAETHAQSSGEAPRSAADANPGESPAPATQKPSAGRTAPRRRR